MSVTRRGLLAGTGGAGLAWALTSGRDPAAGAGNPATDWLDLPTGGPGAAIAPAQVRRSSDGVPEVELVASPLASDHPLRGLVSAGYADGVAGTPPSVPGPTLLMPPGRRLRVVLRNHLDQMTSLHLHGLRIAPAVDAPFAMVEPGASRVYDVTTPATQVGTYWYHPHVHGLVEPQMRSGLTGGMTMDRPQTPTPVQGVASALLVLTALEDEQHILVNGQREPSMTLASPVRLRMVNTSTSLELRLSLDGHGAVVPMTQVATDDGWLERAVTRPGISLSPGERAEVVVALPGAGAELLALDPDGGDPVLLATLTGSGSVPAGPVIGRLAHVRRLLPGPHIRTRRITFGLGSGTTFTIDGRSFDPRRVDVRVRRGSTEVWELVNHTSLDHPFHIHSYPFQVLSRGHSVETLAAWRDVVLLRPYETVRVLIPFHGYSGRTVFHCHNVAHEDAGMMATVLVT